MTVFRLYRLWRFQGKILTFLSGRLMSEPIAVFMGYIYLKAEALLHGYIVFLHL